MGRQGPHQRTLLALGSKRGVDLPDRSLRSDGRARAHEGARQPCCRAQRIGLLEAIDCLGYEDDIDIADVVQFPATALAHPDDGQPAGEGALPHLGARDGQRGLECGVGQITEPGGDRLHLDQATEITGRDAEQLPAVGQPQGIHCCRDIGCHRLEHLGIGTHGGEQRVPHTPRRRRFGEGVRIGEDPEVIGHPDQVVAERLGRAQDVDHPTTEALVGRQPATLLRPAGLDQPQELGQREVGIGSGPELLGEFDESVGLTDLERIDASEGVEGQARPIGIGESDARELSALGARSIAHGARA